MGTWTWLDANALYEKAHKILETVLDEVTLEYFTGEDGERRERAAKRMLEIGPLLWESPKDLVHVCVYEQIGERHPEVYRDNPDDPDMDRYLRADADRLAETVTEDTTWKEFIDAVVQSIAEKTAHR
jgi:hypothetical protein